MRCSDYIISFSSVLRKMPQFSKHAQICIHSNGSSKQLPYRRSKTTQLSRAFYHGSSKILTMARGNLLKLSTPDNVLSSIACFISASSFSAFGVRCPTAEHTSPLTLGCPFQSSDDSLVCPLDLRIPPMHLSAWNWSSGSAAPRDGPASRSSCSLRSNQVQPPSMQSKTFFYE